MRRFLNLSGAILMVGLFFFSGRLAAQSGDEAGGDYHVAAGDVLHIDVLDHEDLKRDAKVTSDGTISFPLIGDVQVKGMTVSEIGNLIESKLQNGYLKYPQVNVALSENKGGRFFVYGEVEKPGAYEIEGGMTVLKAVSLAGGLTKFGSARNIKILREPTDGNAQETIKVNLNKVTRKSDRAKDVTIQPGDVIMVSE